MTCVRDAFAVGMRHLTDKLHSPTHQWRHVIQAKLIPFLASPPHSHSLYHLVSHSAQSLSVFIPVSPHTMSRSPSVDFSPPRQRSASRSPSPRRDRSEDAAPKRKRYVPPSISLRLCDLSTDNQIRIPLPTRPDRLAPFSTSKISIPSCPLGRGEWEEQRGPNERREWGGRCVCQSGIRQVAR